MTSAPGTVMVSGAFRCVQAYQIVSGARAASRSHV